MRREVDRRRLVVVEAVGVRLRPAQDGEPAGAPHGVEAERAERRFGLGGRFWRRLRRGLGRRFRCRLGRRFGRRLRGRGVRRRRSRLRSASRPGRRSSPARSSAGRCRSRRARPSATGSDRRARAAARTAPGRTRAHVAAGVGEQPRIGGIRRGDRADIGQAHRRGVEADERRRTLDHVHAHVGPGGGHRVLDPDGADGLAVAVGASIEIEGSPRGGPGHVGGPHGVGVHVAPDAMPRPPGELLDLDVVAERDEPDGRGRGEAGLALSRAASVARPASAAVSIRSPAWSSVPSVRAIATPSRVRVAPDRVGDASRAAEREERPAVERHHGDHDAAATAAARTSPWRSAPGGGERRPGRARCGGRPPGGASGSARPPERSRARAIRRGLRCGRRDGHDRGRTGTSARATPAGPRRRPRRRGCGAVGRARAGGRQLVGEGLQLGLGAAVGERDQAVVVRPHRSTPWRVRRGPRAARGDGGRRGSPASSPGPRTARRSRGHRGSAGRGAGDAPPIPARARGAGRRDRGPPSTRARRDRRRTVARRRDRGHRPWRAGPRGTDRRERRTWSTTALAATRYSQPPKASLRKSPRRTAVSARSKVTAVRSSATAGSATRRATKPWMRGR